MVCDGSNQKGSFLKFTLLMPTWNEYESMKHVVPLIDRSLFDQIIVVDGGSTDGTIEYARSLGFEVHVQQKRGLREAYREAMALITSDVIITFSPDGNSLADRLPALIEKMREGYDMVIVSRYLPPATSHDDGLITQFGNWFFTWLINLLHGGHYTDSFVIFRAYKTALLTDLDLLDPSGYVMAETLFRTDVPVEPLLSIRAARANCRIGEISGSEPARIAGERKMQMIRWGLSFLYQIIREAFPRQKKRPDDTFVKP